MTSFDRTSSQSLPDIIERFMQEERIVVDAFRAQIASAEGSATSPSWNRYAVKLPLALTSPIKSTTCFTKLSVT